MALPWFSTKGQIVQVLAAVFAGSLATVKYWPDMKHNEYLSTGALIFYSLWILLAAMLFEAIRRSRAVPIEGTGSPGANPGIVIPAEQQGPKISLVEVSLSSVATDTYKVKIRPLFRNLSGDCVDVRFLSWRVGALRAWSPLPRATLQVKQYDTWLPVKETDEVHVPDLAVFRLWLGPDGAHSLAEAERARDDHQLGAVVLLVNGQELSITL